MNVDVAVIDNKSYVEVDRIVIKGRTYAYLVNSTLNRDFTIRRIIAKNGDIYYEGLSDKKEFQLALMYFTKKHKNIFDKSDIE